MRSSDYVTKPFQPQEVLARIETQLRLYMGDVHALQASAASCLLESCPRSPSAARSLQETAERNVELLKQILPPHILTPLQGGTRVVVEKFAEV